MSWAEDEGIDCYPDDRKVRIGIWITKDGKELRIKKMTDNHLLNAYKKTLDDELFEEMVLRLFEDRTRGAK